MPRRIFDAVAHRRLKADADMRDSTEGIVVNTQVDVCAQDPAGTRKTIFMALESDTLWAGELAR